MAERTSHLDSKFRTLQVIGLDLEGSLHVTSLIHS